MLKAVVQKGISFLPASQSINYLFQKYVTKGLELTDALFEDRLGHCADHIYAYKRYGLRHDEFTTLELGTGWYPIVPIGMYLCGATQILSIDISSLLNEEQIKLTVERFINYANEAKLGRFLPYLQEERLKELERFYERIDSFSGVEMLEHLGIRTMVGDARDLALADSSVDLIHSNNTFEHVYPNILSDILKEFKRVLRADGVMSHFIDMSDHFAHLDEKISIYNFLRFSEAAWAWIDNGVQPQNRYRLPEYRQLYYDLGISIVEEDSREGDMEALRKIPLDGRFESMKMEEVAVSHTLLISTENDRPQPFRMIR